MNSMQRMFAWGDTHHAKWLDIIRIALGAFLVYKAIDVGQHPGDIKASMDQEGSALFSLFSIQYIIIVQLVGGLLIAMGLLTRWAVVFQLPILIGALFLLRHESMFSAYSQVWSTALVFVLLLVFLVEGSGPWSVDEYMRTHRNA